MKSKNSKKDIKIERTERVIFIWAVPAANGHMNPILIFTNELLLKLKTINVDKIIFYNEQSFRDIILNLPNNVGKNLIEFREYNLRKKLGNENYLNLVMDFDTRPGSFFRAIKLFENAVKIGAKHVLADLMHDLHVDKPVVVLYDQALYFSKLAFDIYEIKYKCPKPLHCAYSVTIFFKTGLFKKDVYPSAKLLFKMGFFGDKPLKNASLTTIDYFKYLANFYKSLSNDLNLSARELLKVKHKLSKNFYEDDLLNIIFVIPQIQPNINEYEKMANFVFVGPCIDEEARYKLLSATESLNIAKYSRIIEQFLEANKLEGRQKPVIYVSMGTLFNNENADLFKILVEACKHYSNRYAIIVSAGNEKTYEIYANSPLNSEGVLFVAHAPQLEILKKAHLFITHAGMNSTSEAIHYGVPIICLPLSGDQPFVAWRIAELQMGIRLQPDKSLTVEKVKMAINEILTNSIYKQRIEKYSAFSKDYKGHETGVKHLIKFIIKNKA